MKLLNIRCMSLRAKVVQFSLFGNGYRIGIWNRFPPSKLWAYRKSQNTDFKGWQIDFLWLSVAKHLKRPVSAV